MGSISMLLKFYVFYPIFRWECDKSVQSSIYLSPHPDGVVEYIDCISAESKDPTNECPRYDIKPSNGGTPGL